MTLKAKISRWVAVSAAVLLLVSCSATDKKILTTAIQNVSNGKSSSSNDIKAVAQNFVAQKKQQYQDDPTAIIRDVQNLKALLDQLKGNAGKVWGEKDSSLPSRKKYVKYTDNYRTKATVDFAAGTITVETLNSPKPKDQLKSAIVTTLLTTDDPSSTDIFSDQTPQFSGEPYLFGQVLDQDRKPIRYQWRANRFADYLIAKQLQRSKADKGTRHYVTFPLVKNHHHLRKQQYSEYVLAAANRYQVSPTLIYAIIETESSFNPFAVSSANAYGLMQVVPKTAGKDVYQRIKKRNDMPTKSVLFTPEQNIDIGTAYLHILDDIYLKNLINVTSREYSVISAYNGGAGNVMKTFSKDRKLAPAVINGLAPAQVYWRLTQRHPRAESRRYLEKVTEFRKKYQ